MKSTDTKKVAEEPIVSPPRVFISLDARLTSSLQSARHLLGCAGEAALGLSQSSPFRHLWSRRLTNRAYDSFLSFASASIVSASPNPCSSRMATTRVAVSLQSL